jgi:hypothetical protein
MSEQVETLPRAVVWDVGRVLYRWNIRHLYEKLIVDPDRLDWFLAHVVTKSGTASTMPQAAGANDCRALRRV